MARDTIRDQIWDYALTVVVRGERALKPEDVIEVVGTSDQTARDALNTIASKGYIGRDVREDGSVRFIPTDEFSDRSSAE